MNDEIRDDQRLLYCSFCGKGQHEVTRMIQGDAAIICDECVRTCADIINADILAKRSDGEERHCESQP